VRRRHCVGGGSPVNFGRWRGAPPVPKIGGVGGQKMFFSKIPEKISFYPQNFLMAFFSHRKLQQNNLVHSNNGIGGAPTNYRRRRRVQSTTVDCGAHKLSAARPAHGFSSIFDQVTPFLMFTRY